MESGKWKEEYECAILDSALQTTQAAFRLSELTCREKAQPLPLLPTFESPSAYFVFCLSFSSPPLEIRLCLQCLLTLTGVLL